MKQVFRIKYKIEVETEVEVTEKMYNECGKNWDAAVRRMLNLHAKKNNQIIDKKSVKINAVDVYDICEN